MKQEPTQQLSEAIRHGHEPDYVDSRWMKLSIVGLVVLVVCALLIVYATRAFFSREVSSNNLPTSVIERTGQTKGPQATADQPQQLRELRDAEQQRLESYEWIDESAGTARIPIARAIKILAKQGLPEAAPKSDTAEEQHE